MDIKEVKELIELINSSDIAYLEIKTEDGHIKMDKSLTRGVGKETSAPQSENHFSYVEEKEEFKKIETKEEKVVETREVQKIEEAVGTIVTSPMVGTFYASPSPTSKNFVEVGDTIKVGDPLCIIEAMKLMNEIESELNGEVVQILVKDGDMVEYGTPIFKVKESN